MSTSNTSIMSIGEMIDTAFGDPEVNIVNHKLLQTILYLLARQLRILERRVKIEMVTGMQVSSGSSLSVTEVKMHAMQKKKKGPSETNKGRSTKIKSAQEPGSLSDKTSSSKDKSSSSKSATEKTTTETTSSTAKSTSDKTSTEKSTDKSSSTKSTDKSTTDKSTTDKSTTDKSTTDKSTTDKSTTEKSSTDKSTTDKSTEKSSSGKSTIEKSTGKSPAEKSTTEKSSEEKWSSEKRKTRGTDKTSTKTFQDYGKLLEKVEEQRERELRVIHQRTTSREERERTPTPMASLDSVEAQYEKLLIVERVPTDASKDKPGKRQAPTAPRLSIVTQEQFAELSETVQELMSRLAPFGTPGFPENIELMQELRKNASLADAMAALQLAARLEAAEKTLKQMLSLVTELATKTGIDLTEIQHEDEVETEILLGAKKKAASKPSSSSRKAGRKPSPTLSLESIEVPVLKSPPHATAPPPPPPEPFPTEKPSTMLDFVTYEELDSAMQELYDEINKTITGITTRSSANADNAFKIAAKLEGKLEASLNLGNRMEDLEVLVSTYADQINALDTGLSSQMTNYQEQLTQMQHDLETGLENMAEQLANADTDTTAVAELNTHFTNLQQDLDNSAINQKELKDNQRALTLDLESLWKQIELLRETKSDREEVADALRDKAGIGALNGLVSLQQFDAVRGDFEKRIGSAYDKFNNQEIIWQKAIDDVLRELSDKADWIQVVSLRDDITKYIDMLKSRMQAMFEIVGEPRAASITRRLHRDAACLSCANPAWMELEEPRTMPAIPAMPATRPPTIGAEASKPKEDGDHGAVCYPGHPLPHPRDVRSHFCQRFCGGSHTLISNTVKRSPPEMIISHLRKVSTTLGTDGKIYKTDEITTKVPCKECNQLISTTPEPTEAAQTPEPNDTSSNMTPSDFRRMTDLIQPSMEQVSVTPPPPTDEDL